MTNELFRWFKHKFINPDVRALNATIIVDSTLKTIIGKEYCVWRWQMNYLADSSTTPICPDVRALNATIFIHSTPNSIIGKGIVHEDLKWVIYLNLARVHMS